MINLISSWMVPNFLFLRSFSKARYISSGSDMVNFLAIFLPLWVFMDGKIFMCVYFFRFLKKYGEFPPWFQMN